MSPSATSLADLALDLPDGSGDVGLDVGQRASSCRVGSMVRRWRHDSRVTAAPVILALDQGTTGHDRIVFDAEGRPAGRAYSEFGQHFPRPGWVEHDAPRSGTSRARSAREALDAAGRRRSPRWRASASPTSARPSSPGTATTGEPLHRALVWQDRRTAERCDELREAGHEPLVRERTGLVLDPYFSGHQDRVADPPWRRRPGRRLRSARSTPGWSSSSPAATPPTTRTLRARCCSTPARWRGTPSCASCSACRSSRCPRPARARTSTARRASSAAACRSRGSPGDQQAALYGQACHTPGSARTPTAPAASCSRTPAASAPEPRGGPA